METEAKMSKYLVCAYREWNLKMFAEKLQTSNFDFVLISDKNLLTLAELERLNPTMIFFLDWSWIIDKEITDNFMCVGFHSASLPQFRGGSPIQNQIVRGIKNTKLSAFKMDGGIDTGDILLQEDISLEGHIDDIMKRICKLSYGMILSIVAGNYVARPQSGESSYFSRRKPNESEMNFESFNQTLENIYDFIRMLEYPYPNAFLVIGDKKIIFKRAEKDNDKIKAEIEIVGK